MTAEQRDTRCTGCGWDAPVCRCDEFQDFDYDDEPDFDEWEDETADCCGYFSEHDGGRFICGAIGSEDCDWCPCYSWLGKTAAEVEQEEVEQIEKQMRHEEWLRLKDFAP